MIIGNPIMAGASGPAASIFVTGLSETDTVTAVHKKTVQVPNPAAHGLPDGYTELEYIESTGTQYIDVLNFEVASDFGFEIDFAAAYISGQGLFSFHDNDGGTWTRLYDVNNHRYVSRFDNEQYFTPTSDRQIVTLNGSSGDVAIDGVTQFTLSTISNTASGIMCIFGMETLGNHSGLSTGKIYSLKFKTGSDTTHSFIPAKRNSDFAIGLYDLVNNVFYTNAGTGTFTAGSEIPAYIEITVDDKTLTGKWTQKPNPASVVPDGYTQLEYIESTGTQYINTGLNCDKYIVRAKYKYTAESYHILSAYNSSNGAFEWIGQYNNFHRIVALPTMDWKTSSSTLSIGTVYEEVSKILDGEQSLSVDGVTVINQTYSSITVPNAPVCMFAYSLENSDDFTKAIVYKLSISDKNDKQLRDFIPAKRNSDGAIGMYDLITNTFYGNSGTGTFNAGPEIPQTIDGFLIKPIRDFGTWTVTATNGEKTDTQDVMVDAITEYEIEMSLYKLWLYRNGDECEDISGGWSVNDNINWANYSTRGFVSKGETIKLWANSNNRVSAVQTSNPIDLTGFSKLIFRFGNPSGTSSIAFGFASTTSGNINENYLVPPAKYMWDTTTPVNTYELDISSLNGFYYATFAFVSSGSSSDASSAELEYAYLFD